MSSLVYLSYEELAYEYWVVGVYVRQIPKIHVFQKRLDYAPKHY